MLDIALGCDVGAAKGAQFLYFTAGPESCANGIFGVITAGKLGADELSLRNSSSSQSDRTLAKENSTVALFSGGYWPIPSTGLTAKLEVASAPLANVAFDSRGRISRRNWQPSQACERVQLWRQFSPPLPVGCQRREPGNVLPPPPQPM